MRMSLTVFLVLLGLVALCNSRSFENVVKQSMAGKTHKSDEGQHWALLVAGSSGWYNYRHQADVCHAFQVLKKNGIPEENIVVMMYDDIANNEENPTKGIIINHPNGTDVYKGVPKDYTGSAVNPKNFLNIMQGIKPKDENGKTIGSGKVIASGPKDHVFVNFVDHGGPGIVAFPEKMLSASRWNNAIKKMHREQKYSQMVIYLEACESGSMFNKLLPDNINVFVTTASSPTQSSYACYYDDARETYLGDVYSVKWMEDSDKEDLSAETLKKQYTIVKKETNTSIVEEYGEISIADEKVGEFQGDMKRVNSKDVPKITYPHVPLDAVPSPDVPLAILRHRLAKETSPEEEEKIKQEIRQILDNREKIAELFWRIVKTVAKDKDMKSIFDHKKELTNHQCYERIVEYFDDHCMNIAKNDHVMRHLYTFVNLCEKEYTHDSIIDAMAEVCVPKKSSIFQV